jgi:adenylosuccinate lyase
MTNAKQEWKFTSKEIAEKADVSLIDFKEVRRLLEKTGHFVMAIILAWSKVCKKSGYAS